MNERRRCLCKTYVSSLRRARSFSHAKSSDRDALSKPQPPNSNRAFASFGWLVQPCAERCNSLVSPLQTLTRTHQADYRSTAKSLHCL